MQIELLNTKHPEYDAPTWEDYWALYAGGQEFRKRITRMLVRNSKEPDAVYQERIKIAHYRSYLGPIVDYFVSYMFTSQLTIRASIDGEPVEPDEWYATLKEDCDGTGKDLVDFLRDRLTRALVDGRAWWIVELPDDGGERPQSRKEWQDRHLGDVTLRAIDRSQLLDWGIGADGQMDWAIVYAQEHPRRSPTSERDTILHRWWLYDRENVELFEYLQKKGQPINPKTDVGSVGGPRRHGFTRVPLVDLSVPVGLWVANRIESPQREHFALSNAHTWAIRRTCYAMPVFKIKDAQQPPTFGTGYYIMIGTDEDVVWSAPPATPFEMISAEVKAQKDEIFRIIHQMSLGVENNASTIGRSGWSKREDAVSTTVILTAYGACIRESVEKMYQLISDGRSEPYAWSIEGMDKFSPSNALDFVQAVTQALTIDIPSPTWGKEVRGRVALALVPDASQGVKDTILNEIETNFSQELMMDSYLDSYDSAEGRNAVTGNDSSVDGTDGE
jgi:hypothetical protein